jgi:CMP-N,N'-diacetyllegionaminic acid synthase
MIALIPARGGSKGILDKNIKEILGKPLIAYTIECALASKEIERVICSTDSEAIANIAVKYGAEVPFMRPARLASDNAQAIDTYIYTIEKLAEMGAQYNEMVVLLPTSPLRLSLDIDNAIALFREKNADSVISYVPMQHPPTWARTINANMTPENYFETGSNIENRQELEPAYMCNGSIYIFKFALLKELRVYETEKTFAYIMPPERSIDIDEEYDIKLAEYFLKK